MSKVPDAWVEKAQYDLDTAKAMLESKRYIYVLFCCQQAVEKMIKALIAKRTNECPPRSHNLMLLAERASIESSDDQDAFLRQLSASYIQSRYPEEIQEMSKALTQEQAQEVVRKTEEMFQWLSSML